MPKMSKPTKSAESRVRHELEKRGLPTFGSPERCRLRLERHLDVERKPAKKHITFKDEAPGPSYYFANGQRYRHRRIPVMNPEEDIDWDVEEAEEREYEFAAQQINEFMPNTQRDVPDALNDAFAEDDGEVVIRPDNEAVIQPENEAAGIAAWQNFVQEQQIAGATDFYRQYITSRIRGNADVLERFLNWHEYEDSLFVHQNGFAEPQEN